MTKPPPLTETPESWRDFLRWLSKHNERLAKSVPSGWLSLEQTKFLHEFLIATVELGEEIGGLQLQVRDLANGMPGKILERGDVADGAVHVLAKADDKRHGKSFELGLLKTNGNAPCVFSVQSGRAFVVGWNELSKAALDKGIDRAVVIA